MSGEWAEAVAEIAGEEWRAIAEAPGYEVSDAGRVRSYWSNAGWVRESPRILKAGRGPTAMTVALRLQDGRRRNRLVHRLVLEAFRCACPAGCEACHNDGNWANNRLENLRWDTHRNNMADMARHGTRLFGERHPNAKLLDVDRVLIPRLLRRGFSVRRIAKFYGWCKATVRKAKEAGPNPRHNGEWR